MGSHVVFVWIHRMEKCLTSFPQCFKLKRVEISPCFLSLPRKLYTIFQHTFFSQSNEARISYFEYRLCHKILVTKIEPEL